MKLIVDRHALAEALAATTTVIAARTPKPILQCVRITAEADCLILSAYDQEVGLRYRISQVEVSKPGETLVMAQRLADIVNASADETVTMETKEDLLHLRGQDSHFQIYGQNVREFPPIPDFEGEADFTVKIGPLASGIDRTAFAAARESTRYAINGVLWERKGKKLQLIATDGRRLAWGTVALEKTGDAECSAIVPVKTLHLISKLRQDPEEIVEVKTTANQIFIRMPRATISSVLVEGHFPKYEDVIPRECTRTAELDTQEFLSAVRRAALLTNEESKGVRLNFTAEQMVLSSRAPEQGEATINAAVKLNGAPIEIGFNPVFLMDALKVCGESVMLEMKEPTKPGVIKCGTEFLYVIMPVTLS